MKSLRLVFVIYLCLCSSNFVKAQEWKEIVKESVSLFNQSKYDSAIAILNRIKPELEAAYQSQRDTALLFVLYELGNNTWWKGDYPSTEQYFNDYLEVAKTLYGDRSDQYALRLTDYGYLHFEYQRYDQAIQDFKTSIEIWEEVGIKRPKKYAGTFVNLATVYEYAGDLHLSEQTFLYIIKKLKALDQTHFNEYAFAINNLGALYFGMGRYDEARPLIEEAFLLSNTNSSSLLSAANNLASIYLELEEFEKAKQLYQTSANKWKEAQGKGNINYLEIQSNLANAHLKSAQYDSAKMIIDSTDAYYQTFGLTNNPSYSYLITNRAGLKWQMGDLQGSVDDFKLSLETVVNVLGKDHPLYVKGLHNLSNALIAQNQSDEGIQMKRQALAFNLAHIRKFFPGLSEREQDQYWQSISPNFEGIHSYAPKLQTKDPEMLDLQLNSRLRTKGLLLNSTKGIKKYIDRLGDSELSEKYQQWTILRNQLATAFRLPTAQQQAQGININELDSLANRLEKELSLHSDFVANAFHHDLDWKELQAQLNDDEAMIEIIRYEVIDLEKSFDFSGKYQYAALIITPEGEHPSYISLGDAEVLEKSVLALFKRDLEEQSYEAPLYEYLWKPLEETLEPYNKIFISPDGVFHQINLSIIPLPNSDKLLSEQKQIIYLNRLQDFLVSKNEATQETKNTHAFLIGNPSFYLGQHPPQNPILIPLPLTQNEVEQIEAYAKENKIESMFLQNNKLMRN